jgi:formamidopyrimidine-DNA glycosylase
MPELPDIVAYIHALESRVTGQPLENLQIHNPFVLRSVEPAVSTLIGKRVIGFRRLGKRIVFELEGQLYVVIHLMIAGRFQWKPAGSRPTKPNRLTLATFTFPTGTLILTEAGSKRRASMHLVAGEAGLEGHTRGGLEVLDATFSSFRDALTRENHTLKRALTDPHLFSGIGNAYSDEILHAAKLSPMKLTSRLEDGEIERLFEAVQKTLSLWAERLCKEVKEQFPEKVTAFRPEMAAHGRFRQPCPVCGTPIQRISYAENEANYCPTCQTGGRLLADRALSRLLKQDWPRTLEEMERRRSGA